MIFFYMYTIHNTYIVYVCVCMYVWILETLDTLFLKFE